MTVPTSILVVGGSVGGLATVEALRRKGYSGRITVLGAEEHEPYDRPPLSKQVLAGDWGFDRVRLRRPEVLARLDAEFLLGDAAVALDTAGRTVRTAAGWDLTADAVVIATGTRPRELGIGPRPDGVLVLRTLDDAVALRTALDSTRRLVVVGDGVLGAEVAATARTLGCQVTLVGPLPAPMTLQFGDEVARMLAALHIERGTVLRPGSGVVGWRTTDGRVSGVELDDGEVLAADTVLVAVGSVPNTEWLAGSGLDVTDGVQCDARCRAADGIHAVGDVARWHHRALGTSMRMENRTNAVEQAAVVAADILGEDTEYTPVPYLWTDQYDAKIHTHGFLPTNATMTVVDGDPAARRFVAEFRCDGRITGVLGWNMAKQARQHRQQVVDAMTFRQSLERS